MSSEDQNLDKLTVAELKAECHRKNLITTGKKAELIKRIRDYESSPTDVKIESEEQEEDNPSAEESETMEVDQKTSQSTAENEETFEDKVLTKWRFMFMYNAVASLKSVMINPFKPTLLGSAELVKWMEQADEYCIKRDIQGTAAAILTFSTIDMGDSCFSELKSVLSDADTDVYHNTLNPKFEADERCFDKLFTFKLEDDSFRRQVILENVPSTVQENTIIEKFPGAFNLIHFGRNLPLVKGIVTLELQSVDKVEEAVKNNKDLELEGVKIPVNKLNTMLNRWAKVHVGSKDTKFVGQELSDEERIEYCEKLNDLFASRAITQDRDDIFGMEKIKIHKQSMEDWKNIDRILRFDTERRIKAKLLPLPESETLLSHSTKKMLKKPGEVDASKADAKKRPSSTPSKATTGTVKKTNAPPVKKAKSGEHNNKGRGGGFVNYGRGRGNFHGQSFNDAYSRMEASRGYGGRPFPGSMQGNMGRANQGYGMGNYDMGNAAMAQSQQVENMVMNLSEKLSRLERLHDGSPMNSSNYGMNEETFGGRLKPDFGGYGGMSKMGMQRGGFGSYRGGFMGNRSRGNMS